MKLNMKMKLLSLAIVGLGGLALAGSAAAACPAGPAQADGGAWTGTQLYQGAVAIASPGLDSTSCRLDSTISAGAGPFASAVVHDASPNAEPRYRAQFTLNVDNLASPGFSDAVQVFSAASSGVPLRLGMFGNGTSWFLSYALGDGVSGSVPLAAGANHVEFDLQIGVSGSLTLWVNNNVEASPTVAPISVDDSAMVGIDDAYLGLAAPSGAFIAAYAGQAAEFDQFDSRRSTFIGF